MPAAPEGGCKDMRGDASSMTNRNKSCADTRKINMYTIQGYIER